MELWGPSKKKRNKEFGMITYDFEWYSVNRQVDEKHLEIDSVCYAWGLFNEGCGYRGHLKVENF